jgi:hypothetical protein
LPVSVFGVPNTGIPVSVYTGLETLVQTMGKVIFSLVSKAADDKWKYSIFSRSSRLFLVENCKTFIFYPHYYYLRGVGKNVWHSRHFRLFSIAPAAGRNAVLTTREHLEKFVLRERARVQKTTLFAGIQLE